MSYTQGQINANVGLYAEQKPEPSYVNMPKAPEEQEEYVAPQHVAIEVRQASQRSAGSSARVPSTKAPAPPQYHSSTEDVLLPKAKDGEVPEKSFRSRTGGIYSKPNEIQYTVEDVPPWYLCAILGFQHYLVMFGATVANPLVLAPAFCIAEDDKLAVSMIIGTIFVCSGLATLLQTTLGNRLPIVQGGTFTFVAPSFAILSLPQWKCPAPSPTVPPGMDVTMAYLNSTAAVLNSTLSGVDTDEPLWKPRIREIQGAVMVASLFQVLIGFSGIMGFLLRWIGPLAIAPTISLAGLALFEVATGFASKQWWIALVTIVLIAMFSQYTKNIAVPCCRFKRGQGCVKVNFPLFRLFPIILAISITWFICYVLTAVGVFSSEDGGPGYGANTKSRMEVLQHAPWFRLPYPGQWGVPTVSTAAVFGMLAGVLASMVESVGDYYACARIAQVPPPPMHAINRGIGMEGIGCVLAGAFGSGSGTTSYSENIGAIGITKVASRRVIQTGAVIMLVMGTFGKFGALFVTIPDPIIGGVFIVMFGMITAVGISNLQFVDLNSSRNLFIIGFSFFFGLALPQYLDENPDTIHTGSEVVDQIVLVLLRTSMFVGGLSGFVLDNTIPGTDEERGLIKWRKQLIKKRKSRKTTEEETKVANIYEIPFLTRILKRWSWTRFVPFFPTFDEDLISFENENKTEKKKKKRRRNAVATNGIEDSNV